MRQLTCVSVALLALAACTSRTTASRTSPSPSAAISRSEYQSRANAICASMNAKGNALQDPGTDQAKLKQVVDQAIPITSDGLAQLRQLPQPSGDEATIQGFFAKLDKLIADLKDESAALQANDLPKASQIATPCNADSAAATSPTH